jgi:hypothetical protein
MSGQPELGLNNTEEEHLHVQYTDISVLPGIWSLTTYFDNIVTLPHTCRSAVDGVRPLPPGYKVTAQSVANKGEPFLSGLVPQPHTLQAFLDSCSSRAATNATITHTEGTSGQTNSSTSSTGKAAGKPPMPVPVQPPSAAHHNTTNGTSNSVPTAAVPITTPGTGVAPAAAAPAGVELRWELSELLSPQQQLAASLPHIAWDDAVPPILSFYSFAAATLHPAST